MINTYFACRKMLLLDNLNVTLWKYVLWFLLSFSSVLSLILSVSLMSHLDFVHSLALYILLNFVYFWDFFQPIFLIFIFPDYPTVAIIYLLYTFCLKNIDKVRYSFITKCSFYRFLSFSFMLQSFLIVGIRLIYFLLLFS